MGKGVSINYMLVLKRVFQEKRNILYGRPCIFITQTLKKDIDEARNLNACNVISSQSDFEHVAGFS